MERLWILLLAIAVPLLNSLGSSIGESIVSDPNGGPGGGGDLPPPPPTDITVEVVGIDTFDLSPGSGMSVLAGTSVYLDGSPPRIMDGGVLVPAGVVINTSGQYYNDLDQFIVINVIPASEAKTLFSDPASSPPLGESIPVFSRLASITSEVGSPPYGEPLTGFVLVEPPGPVSVVTKFSNRYLIKTEVKRFDYTDSEGSIPCGHDSDVAGLVIAVGPHLKMINAFSGTSNPTGIAPGLDFWSAPIQGVRGEFSKACRLLPSLMGGSSSFSKVFNIRQTGADPADAYAGPAYSGDGSFVSAGSTYSALVNRLQPHVSALQAAKVVHATLSTTTFPTSWSFVTLADDPTNIPRGAYSFFFRKGVFYIYRWESSGGYFAKPTPSPFVWIYPFSASKLSLDHTQKLLMFGAREDYLPFIDGSLGPLHPTTLLRTTNI